MTFCVFAKSKNQNIFLENVKGLATKRFENTFNTLKQALKDMGYGDLHYAILNTKDYGIPQNRERLWMFARLGGLPENFSMVPPHIDNGLRLSDFVDKKPDKSLYLSQQQIQRIKDFYGIPSLLYQNTHALICIIKILETMELVLPYYLLNITK